MPAERRDRLVSFVDLAPTVLSLAGHQAAAVLCRGSAFLGPARSGAARTYTFGFRGRMDERYDLVRSRPRPALRLHPQLHAAQDLRPAPRLHVPDADDARSGRSSTTRAS